MTAFLARVALVAAAGGVLALAQRLAPEDPHPTRTWTGRFWDATFIAQYLVLVPLVGLTVAALIPGVAGSVPVLRGLPFAARVAVGLLGLDLMLYGLHRASHRYRWLWTLHSVHHRPTEVGWATAFRFHLGGFVIQQNLPLLVLVALGVGSDALAVVVATVFVVSVFGHANLEVPPGPMSHLVATPRFHRTHHEVGRDQTNFAVLFPLIDVLFGTADFTVPTRRRFGTGTGLPSQRGDQVDGMTANSSAPRLNDAKFATPLSVAANTGSRNR